MPAPIQAARNARPSPPVSPDSVLEFWFSPDMRKQWFTGGAELDGDIRQRFGPAVALAQAGELIDWESEAQTRLALVILLDQFPRNIFRGKSEAFVSDERAQRLVSQGLGRLVFYMPLMHAEDLQLQEEGVRRFRILAVAAPEDLREDMQSSLRSSEQHRDIIARLGRFPHSNLALGRTNTALESDFLKVGPRFGQ